MDDNSRNQKFAASMRHLEKGDIVYRTRGGRQLCAVVLAAESTADVTRVLALSCFAFIPTNTQWPRPVFFRNGMLTDETGALLLMPEEWQGTNKGGASVMIAALEDQIEREQRRIAESLADPSKTFTENAREVLKIMGHNYPTNEELRLLAFSLSFTPRNSLGRG